MTAALRRVSRTFTRRRTLVLDWWTGETCDADGGRGLAPACMSVDDVCDLAGAEGFHRVLYVGERPGGDAHGFAGWRRSTSWVQGEHYLRDLLNPVLRYSLGATKVELRSAGAWFGDHVACSPHEACTALMITDDLLGRRFPGAMLLASPQATGTDLLLRTLPQGEWHPMDADLQELVRSTSGQGRVEMWPGGQPAGDDLPGLVEYDGRFMYAALCRDLADANPIHVAGGAGQVWIPSAGACGYRDGTHPLMMRSRWLVDWTVPDDWRHVGILPMLTEHGWAWPRTPGQRCSGWVDAVELHLAYQHGWRIVPREAIVWPNAHSGGPLRRWAAELVAARNHAGLLGLAEPVGSLVGAALRAVLLTSLGTMHGRGHHVTRSGTADELPEGRKDGLRMEGGGFTWTDDVGPARPELAHPEWTSAVWARCRARLLSGPAVQGRRTGALHVDPATVVGFSVDALYLSADPDWPDDGAVGRLRRRGTYGPMPAPMSRRDLLTSLQAVRA